MLTPQIHTYEKISKTTCTSYYYFVFFSKQLCATKDANGKWYSWRCKKSN